jgi:plastocyanin
MPDPRALLRLAAAALLLTLAACGSSSSATSASPVATSAVALPPSYRFEPAAIAVPPGTEVTWTNGDNFSHSVQFLDGGLAAEPLLMRPGESVTFTFAAAGLYHYQCHLHPQNMKGSVTVGP